MSLRFESDERRRGWRARLAAALTVLVVVASLAALPAIGTAQEGTDPTTFVIQQGNTCTQVQSLGDGTESVESFYDYQAFNTTPGVQLPANYSSLGTVDLQMGGTSQVFVYEGSQGLSLVFLHDKINEPGGFVATAEISGLPGDGQPVVEDDDYAERDDVFEYTETGAHIEWFSNGGRTDGWAYRGLESSNYRAITIDIGFNQDSGNYPFEKWDASVSNRIERFVARSGTGDVTELAMSQPLTIGPGTCAGGIVPNTPSSGPAPGTPTVTTAAPSPPDSTPGSGETPLAAPTTTFTPTATAIPTATSAPAPTTTSTPAPTATPLPDSSVEGPPIVETTSASDGGSVAGTPTDDANAGSDTGGDGTGETGRIDNETTTDPNEGGSIITGDGFGIVLAVAAIVALVAAVVLSRHDG